MEVTTLAWVSWRAFSLLITSQEKLQAHCAKWRMKMQGTVLAETEAFITRQREQLLQQRQELLNQQQALQQQLDEVDGMLAQFDVFEGKTGRPRQPVRHSP